MTSSISTRAKRATRTVALAGISLAIGIGGQADAKKRVPNGNLTDNPSFATSTKGWGGFAASVRRVKSKKAPVGHSAALVAANGATEGYTIDDAPADVADRTTQDGVTYKASAWVRAAKATRGKTAGIVIRETTSTGEFVTDTEGTIRLPRKRFARVSVKHEASAPGNVIDVYVRRVEDVASKDKFLVDGITVVPVAKPPVEEPPVEEPPVEEPPVEEPPVEEPPVEEPPVEEPPVEEPPAEGPTTTSQTALVTSHESPLFQDDGSKYSYIMIRDNLHNRVDELRSVHPEAKILLYKNAAFTVDGDNCQYYPFQGAGVDFCEANRHESWFLHSGSGSRMRSESYTSQLAMDIGNPGYQQEWIDQVLARLGDAENDGSNVRYDGVWMDDVNLYPGHGMDGRIAGMSDAQYRAAMVEFMDVVGPALEDAGFLAVPNLGMDPWDPAHRTAAVQVAGDASMINREGLVRWGDDGMLWTEDGDAPFWKYEVELAEDIQEAGADYHAMTYGSSGDVQAQRYARATFLMAWDGSEGDAFNYRTNNGNDWGDEWTTDVGTPEGNRTKVGQGWKREFSNGVAVINTASTGSQTFNLGGSYEQPDGSCVSSVALGAKRAMVMPAC